MPSPGCVLYRVYKLQTVRHNRTTKNQNEESGGEEKKKYERNANMPSNCKWALNFIWAGGIV